jgi:histone H3/H4
MADVLVVKSKVRAYTKKKKMNLGGDAVVQLTKEVKRLLDRAVERAKANGRKTVKARDI